VSASPPGDLFALGRITGYWGRRGMVKVAPDTDFPERVAAKRQLVLWRADTGARSFAVREGRVAGRFLLLGLEGVDDISAAEELKGSLVMTAEEGLEPLPAGTYYRHQILGLAVRDPEGRGLGLVEDILSVGPHDVYVVRGGGGELLIPAVSEFILRIDLEQGELVVRPPREYGAAPAKAGGRG
jgi:16S rRNA processing protein RimM